MNMQAVKLKGEESLPQVHDVTALLFFLLENGNHSWCAGFSFELRRLDEGLTICASHPMLSESICLRGVKSIDDVRIQLGKAVKEGKEFFAKCSREFSTLASRFETLHARANIKRVFPDTDVEKLLVEEIPSRIRNPFNFGGYRCYIFCKEKDPFVYFSLDTIEGPAIRMESLDFAKISECGRFIMRSYDFSIFFWEKVAEQYVRKTMKSCKTISRSEDWVDDPHNEVRDGSIVNPAKVNLIFTSTSAVRVCYKLTVHFSCGVPVDVEKYQRA